MVVQARAVHGDVHEGQRNGGFGSPILCSRREGFERSMQVALVSYVGLPTHSSKKKKKLCGIQG